MSQESKVPPALTAEEWEYALGQPHGLLEYLMRPAEAIIASANHALPDDDPRKITREWVEQLRAWAGVLENDRGDVAGADLRSIADALESYLPPAKETT